MQQSAPHEPRRTEETNPQAPNNAQPYQSAPWPSAASGDIGWMASRQREDGAHWVNSKRVSHSGHIGAPASYAPPAQNAGGGAFGSSSPSPAVYQPPPAQRAPEQPAASPSATPDDLGWMASRQHEDGAHWVTSSRVKHGGHRYTYAPPPTSHGSQPSNKLHAPRPKPTSLRTQPDPMGG